MVIYSYPETFIESGGDSMTYDKDLIAERDARIKLANSLIKWWNVIYDNPNAKNTQSSCTTQFQAPEPVQDVASTPPDNPVNNAEDEEALKLALEIHQRLEREAAIDEALKQAEIEKALAAQK